MSRRGSGSVGTGSPAPGDPGTIVGRSFPRVLGHALSGEVVRFPEGVAGEPTVLLVAYRRAAQPDVDRWLEGLARTAPQTPVYEVPTIPSRVYRPLAGWIDAGMRGGVPREKWRTVVTIYGDGPAVRDFLGEPSRPVACVVLLDRAGVVRWSHDGGYSDAGLEALVRALHGLAR